MTDTIQRTVPEQLPVQPSLVEDPNKKLQEAWDFLSGRRLGESYPYPGVSQDEEWLIQRTGSQGLSGLGADTRWDIQSSMLSAVISLPTGVHRDSRIPGFYQFDVTRADGVTVEQRPATFDERLLVARVISDLSRDHAQRSARRGRFLAGFHGRSSRSAV